MKKNKPHGKMYRSLQAMSVVPILVLGIVITALSYQTVRSSMYEQVHIELSNVASAVLNHYDTAYPGDYSLRGEIALDLYKGETVITRDYSYIDRLKEDTGIEITIFYDNTRILTTLFNEFNIRIVGTAINPQVYQDVYENGEARFYTNTTISNVAYFAYYMPIKNSDGSIVGIVYAGKPCKEVNESVRRAVLPSLLAALSGILIAGFISSSYTLKLLGAFQKIRSFLAKVSTGDLTVELEKEVLDRKDELSEIGRSAVKMQYSLRALLEQDVLTKLNNRRYADKRLKLLQGVADVKGVTFVVGIGDIDFFKSVNDTFGHDCGDIVLKTVAAILKKHMTGKGFAARWGGEEFLFIFENLKLQEAKEITEAMLEEIRQTNVVYEGQTIQVTMTFGLTQGGVGTNSNELLQRADFLLYEGKNNGRNQIVADESIHSENGSAGTASHENESNASSTPIQILDPEDVQIKEKNKYGQTESDPAY